MEVNRASLLERGKRAVFEFEDVLDGAEEAAGVAFDRFPRRHENVGDGAEPPARPGARVRANPGGDLEHLAPELEPDPTFRVAAVDLVADPDRRVDVAAAALHEDREPTELLLDEIARGRVVGRGDERTRADGHRVSRIPENDRDRVPVEVVEACNAHRAVDRMLGDRAEHPDAISKLAPVDADAALAPAGAQTRRPKRRVRLEGCGDERAVSSS